MNEIAKEILSHEAAAQKNEARVIFAVNRILEGADVRQTLYEAYNTKVDFAAIQSKDIEIKSCSDGLEFDSASLLTAEEYSRNKSNLNNKYVSGNSWWLKDGSYVESDGSVVKAIILLSKIGVCPVLHVAKSKSDLKIGDKVQVNAGSNIEGTVISDDLILIDVIIGMCSYANKDSDVAYNNSKVKSFVDNWFSKVKK